MDVSANHKKNLAKNSSEKNVLFNQIFQQSLRSTPEASPSTSSYQLFQSKTNHVKSNVNNHSKKLRNNQKTIQNQEVSSTKMAVGYPLHYAPDEWNVKKTIGTELKEMFKKDEVSAPLRQAFDPKTFIKVLEEKAQTFGLSPAAHKKSVLRMAFITVTRGNNLSKILSQDEASELNIFFQEMKEIYGLSENKPKTPTDVTLPRIATVLSAQIALAIKNGTITTTIVDPKDIHENFPQCMCFSEFGNLIPQRQFEELFYAYCYHQTLFSAKINRNTKPNKSNILHYAKLQRRSDFYTTDEKINYLTSLNLIVGNKINPEIAGAIAYAAQSFHTN